MFGRIRNSAFETPSCILAWSARRISPALAFFLLLRLDELDVADERAHHAGFGLGRSAEIGLASSRFRRRSCPRTETTSRSRSVTVLAMAIFCLPCILSEQTPCRRREKMLPAREVVESRDRTSRCSRPLHARASFTGAERIAPETKGDGEEKVEVIGLDRKLVRGRASPRSDLSGTGRRGAFACGRRRRREHSGSD